MPIQAPTTITGPAAGEFKDTTAAYRQTGPIEKYDPVSSHLRGLMLNGFGPMAPRVDELAREGKVVTTSTLRAAEIAAKMQRGEEEITAAEVAQVAIAAREALEIGLEDPNSPYYQKDAALRNRRQSELKNLHIELNGYLTKEARKPEDITRTIQRYRLPFRAAWPPLQSLRYTQSITEQVTPAPDRPLTRVEISASKRQSRIVETYDTTCGRITQERYGTRPFATLNLEEKRLVSYTTSEELSRQFDDGRVQEILNEVRQGPSQDVIEEALENGKDAEKRFALRVQRIEQDRDEMFRKIKQLGKVQKMSEFQRFLVVDDSTLSQTEIAEAMIKKLGITNEREANALRTNSDRAFNRFFQEMGPLGTITFAGELFRDKLARFAEERGVPQRAEKIAGEPPTKLSPDGLLGLSHGALALQLVDNKLTTDPLKYLQDQGISSAQAKAMIDEVMTTKQLAVKNPDGSYTLNHDKLGEWSDSDLATLAIRGTIDLNDPAQEAELRNKIDTTLTTSITDPTVRGAEVDRRIANIKDLSRIQDRALPQAEKQRLVNKWDKRSLALLALLLGPLYLTSFVNSMTPNEQRSFQNFFG